MSKSHRYSNVERSNQSPCFFLKSFGTQKYPRCLFLQRANWFAHSQSCLNLMSFWIVHMSVIRQLAVGWLPSRPFESLSYHNWTFIRWDYYTPYNTVSGMFTATGQELWTSLACSSHLATGQQPCLLTRLFLLDDCGKGFMSRMRRWVL